MISGPDQSGGGSGGGGGGTRRWRGWVLRPCGRVTGLVRATSLRVPAQAPARSAGRFSSQTCAGGSTAGADRQADLRRDIHDGPKQAQATSFFSHSCSSNCRWALEVRDRAPEGAMTCIRLRSLKRQFRSRHGLNEGSKTQMSSRRSHRSTSHRLHTGSARKPPR